MKRIRVGSSARPVFPFKDKSGLAREAFRIELARSALTTATLFLGATMLLFVSGAEAYIVGLFNARHGSGHSIAAPRILPGTEPSATGDLFSGPVRMLIPSDPGPVAWARMLAGAPALTDTLANDGPRLMPKDGETPKLLPLRAIGTLPDPTILAALPSMFATFPWFYSRQGLHGNPASIAAATDPTTQTGPAPTALASIATNDPLANGAGQPKPAAIPAAVAAVQQVPVTSTLPTLLGGGTPLLPTLLVPTDPVTPPTHDAAGQPATAAIPEPSSWISFILGFGMTGAACRSPAARRRRQGDIARSGKAVL